MLRLENCGAALLSSKEGVESSSSSGSREVVPFFSERLLPVTAEIANRWGAISSQRQILGRPLSMADGLIAATALEHNLILVGCP